MSTINRLLGEISERLLDLGVNNILQTIGSRTIQPNILTPLIRVSNLQCNVRINYANVFSDLSEITIDDRTINLARRNDLFSIYKIMNEIGGNAVLINPDQIRLSFPTTGQTTFTNSEFFRRMGLNTTNSSRTVDASTVEVVNVYEHDLLRASKPITVVLQGLNPLYKTSSISNGFEIVTVDAVNGASFTFVTATGSDFLVCRDDTGTTNVALYDHTTNQILPQRALSGTSCYIKIQYNINQNN